MDKLVAWTGGSTALQWIHGNGNYKQFVKNHTDKIHEKKETAWQYVNTNENSADIASGNMSVAKMEKLLWNGLGRHGDFENSQSDIKTKATTKKEKEAKIIKDMMTSTIQKSDVMDDILQRYSYWKFLRIKSWIQIFLHNYKRLKLERQSGPLTTKEIESSEILWIKTVQAKVQDTLQFKDETDKRNLKLDETHRICICKGSIE